MIVGREHARSQRLLASQVFAVRWTSFSRLHAAEVESFARPFHAHGPAIPHLPQYYHAAGLDRFVKSVNSITLSSSFPSATRGTLLPSRDAAERFCLVICHLKVGRRLVSGMRAFGFLSPGGQNGKGIPVVSVELHTALFEENEQPVGGQKRNCRRQNTGRHFSQSLPIARSLTG